MPPTHTHSEQFDVIRDTCTASPSSKLFLLARRLLHPGIPVNFLLNLVHVPTHRAALASFLAADWCLGKHAHNFFAKSLLPQLHRHSSLINDSGTAPATVCLACWHHRRVMTLEDEFHITYVCPEYAQARNDLCSGLPEGQTLECQDDLLQLLSGSDPTLLCHLARFLARARQMHRALRLKFEIIEHEIQTKSFAAKRAAWVLMD